MPRPPVMPADDKLHIVLDLLAGELTIAEAARRHHVSEQTIGNWKRQFLDGGKAGLGGTSRTPSTSREAKLRAEVEELRGALTRAQVELRMWKRSAQWPLPPVDDLEMIRRAAAMPVSRFCSIIGIPRRTYTRWLTSAQGDYAVLLSAEPPHR